jgi:hypothetical protein
MNKEKIDKLAKAGWVVGSSADFLNLTPEEAAYQSTLCDGDNDDENSGSTHMKVLKINKE